MLTVASAEGVPVISMIAFLPFDNAPFVNANVIAFVALTETCSNPQIACCRMFKLVFVISPQRPAFSPVTINSSLRSVEYDDAIF